MLRIILISLLGSVLASKSIEDHFRINYDDVYPFKHQVGIVTGGSTGIGYATALQIAQKGGHVVFCARDRHPNWYNGSHAEQTINNDPIVKASGGSATFFKADITVPEQVREFIQFTHNIFGKIDFAVNNAGIVGKNARLDQIQDEWLFSDQDSIYNNLYGGIHLVKEETKYWMTHGNPNSTYSIVIISSYNGIRACPGCDLYSASKHGLIGIVKSSGVAFAKTNPQIRVNAVAPGLVNTFLIRNLVKPDPDKGEAITEDHPLWIKYKDMFLSSLRVTNRMAEPEEIANVILFLCTKQASFINGQVISVDGGETAI